MMKTLLFLLCLGVGHCINAQTIERHTFANAGGIMNNGNNFIQYTIGEPIIGLAGTGPSLDQGFWAIFGSEYTLDLDPVSLVSPEIAFYPNPVTDHLTIKMNHVYPYKIVIYNLLSQKMLEQDVLFGATHTYINLRHLSSGNYFLSLSIPELQINKTIQLIKN